MAAGVHGAVFRLKIQPCGLPDPERVHVRPEQHAPAGILAGDVRHHAPGQRAGRIPQRRQPFRHIGGGVGQGGAHLRVPVQGPAIRQKLGLQGFRLRQQSFGIHGHSTSFLPLNCAVSGRFMIGLLYRREGRCQTPPEKKRTCAKRLFHFSDRTSARKVSADCPDSCWRRWTERQRHLPQRAELGRADQPVLVIQVGQAVE